MYGKQGNSVMQLSFPTLLTVPVMVLALGMSSAGAQVSDEPIEPVDAVLADKEARLQMATGQCQLGPEMTDSEVDGRIECNLSAPYRIMTIGNSHESHGYYFFRNLLDRFVTENRAQFLMARTHAPGPKRTRCHYLRSGFPLESNAEECSWLTAHLSDEDMITETYNAIIVSSLRPHEFNGGVYLRYVDRLQKKDPDLKVLVLGTFLDIAPNSCPVVMDQTQDVTACADPSLVRYFNPDEEADIRAYVPDLDFLYVSQTELFCETREVESCKTHVGGASVLRDGHHFNRVGINYLVGRANETGVTGEVIEYLGLDEQS